MSEIMEIKGTEVLAIGDLHISDVFEGRHKDYLANCLEIMNRLVTLVRERAPSCVVLLGDIIGWNETNIRNREILAKVCEFFQEINKICPIYSVRGNHDLKGYPDFQFFVSLGLIRVCNEFDFCTEKGKEIRFHLVNYGEEDRELNICEEDDVSNIVFGHNDYTIDGVTNWYPSHDGIELTTLSNFRKVDMVVSGHIHNPSPELVSVTMPDGTLCNLFYTGCPTRPIKISDNYNLVWVVSFKYDESSQATNFDILPFELRPYTELYFSDDEVINDKDQDEIDEELRKQKLTDVLEEIMKYRMLQGDYLKQIDMIPEGSEAAKELAKQYLQVVLNSERT